MAKPPVATDLNQPFDVHLDFTAQVTLYLEVLIDIIAQSCDLGIG
jgi:hypothetical protein